MNIEEINRAQDTYNRLKQLHRLVSIEEQACIQIYITFLEDNYPINKAERLYEKIKKDK